MPSPWARASTTGRPRRVGQGHVLDDRGEVPRVGLRAEARGPQPVLDVEDSPACGDPAQITGRRVVALPVLEALLIDGDIEVRLQVRELAHVVLERHPEAF